MNQMMKKRKNLQKNVLDMKKMKILMYLMLKMMMNLHLIKTGRLNLFIIKKKFFFLFKVPIKVEAKKKKKKKIMMMMMNQVMMDGNLNVDHHRKKNRIQSKTKNFSIKI